MCWQHYYFTDHVWGKFSCWSFESTTLKDEVNDVCSSIRNCVEKDSWKDKPFLKRKLDPDNNGLKQHTIWWGRVLGFTWTMVVNIMVVGDVRHGVVFVKALCLLLYQPYWCVHIFYICSSKPSCCKCMLYM
jgi:hypothetical protein